MTVSHATEKLASDLKSVVCEGEAKMREASRELTAKARDGIDRPLALAREGCREADKQMRLAAERADSAVRQHPYTAMGIGLGVGLIIGALLLRRR